MTAHCLVTLFRVRAGEFIIIQTAVLPGRTTETKVVNAYEDFIISLPEPIESLNNANAIIFPSYNLYGLMDQCSQYGIIRV